MSQYGLVREKELFGIIKRKVTSKKAALQFSTELSNAAKTYAGLINTDHDLWAKYDVEAREAVYALNLLGMVQVRPLLLAIMANFDVKKVAPAFKKLVAVAVRFQIVGGAGGGTLEKIYSDAARGVAEKKLTSIAEILKGFTTLPNDSAFIAGFKVASISKQALARYYLRMLETGIATATVELVPSTDVRNVNLEHVLPLTPSESWLKDWTADDAKAYQKRLGNLAILSSKMNSAVGNDEFSAKRTELKKSAFHFTKCIGDYEVWDQAAIDDRQASMAEVAAKVWLLKSNRRKGSWKPTQSMRRLFLLPTWIAEQGSSYARSLLARLRGCSIVSSYKSFDRSNVKFLLKPDAIVALQ